jgi:5,10-methylenetetrahydromethanopterin reductase
VAGGGAPRFGIVLLPESLGEFAGLCREVEASGFDLLGVADSQSVFRELYVALTVAAQVTSRVRLGPLVTNPLTRHLVVTASAIASVDEVAGGRALLGLGSGDSAITTIGAPPATLAGLEDAVTTLGRLTAGEPVARGGRTWRVHRSTRRVPVYLAAEGPRTLELAGRVADGVVVGLGLTPEVIDLSLAAIERGARSAGRSLDDLDVWWFAKTNLADSRAQAVAPITMALAASANHAFRFTLEGKAVPPALADRIRGLQRDYDAHHHEIAGAGNAGLTDRWGLTDYLVERFAFAGTPADCAAQVRRALGAGARQFLVTGFVPDPHAFVRRWMREVAPAAASDGATAAAGGGPPGRAVPATGPPDAARPLPGRPA